MQLSVLQWNVWYRQSIQNIADFLQQQNADIICLQELTINYPGQLALDTAAFVAKQLGYTYYQAGLPIEAPDGDTVTFTNGIFSRFPITSQRYCYLNQPKRAGHNDEYPVYVEAELELGDRKLVVATTHLSYEPAFKTTAAKRRETDELLAELRTHPVACVFTGDLNATPRSYTVRQLSRAMQPAGPSGVHKTWTTKPFSYQGFEETELRWRLDYIFTTSDLKVISSGVLSTEYSDHLPVRAIIELPDLG